MAQQQRSGKPWSGANPIPTIQQFVENLDKDKRERDRQIDETTGPGGQVLQDKVIDHQNEVKQRNGKLVTDPVTGNQVEIADVSKKYLERVDNPTVGSAHLCQKQTNAF